MSLIKLFFFVIFAQQFTPLLYCNMKDPLTNDMLKEIAGELEMGMQCFYNKVTGEEKHTVKSLPMVMEKLTQLHKANSKSPLYFLNIFFGASLLFFVLSSFWMFMPKTTIFKKGLYFTLAGVILTLVLLFIR